MDAATADLAGELIRSQLAQGKTIAGPDAVIGATALIRNAALATTNPAHFPFEGLKVYRVNEHGTIR